MSHSGAVPLNVDFIAGYQSIINLLAFNKFEMAADEIEQYQGDHFAPIILKAILQHQAPNCWLAFLRNPYLQREMDCNSLKAMINPAQKAVRYARGSVSARAAFEEITVTIAHHPKWCQMLSYRYFINHVAYDQQLKNFIVNSPGFIRQLEPYHLNLLIDSCKDEVANILVSIAQSILGDHSDCIWANETLKWLYENNQNVYDCLINDLSMDTLREYIQELNSASIVEVAPMDIDDEPLDDKMAVDDEDYCGFPRELEPIDAPQNELSLWVARLEQTFYEPQASQQQWADLQAPIPLRIQREPLQPAETIEENRPSNPLRKSF